MISPSSILHFNQVKDNLSPDLLYTILGPTASGKTQLGVALAKVMNGEVISVDSRQVYRGMDIGTGKDLREYGDVHYHLINIRNPDERYDVSQFQTDFHTAYEDILSRSKCPIAVGGTGLYLRSLFVTQPYIQVPVNAPLREQLLPLTKEELRSRLQRYSIPPDFQVDVSSHKRLVRAVEILEAVRNGLFQMPSPPAPSYPAIIFGIDPQVEIRRGRISQRLKERMDEGLEEEVKRLLDMGMTHEDLQYFGLEYKYTSLYLLGQLDRASFYSKLETEIHRYAKRQMTFFRKMEKEGLLIQWLQAGSTEDQLQEILHLLANKKR